MSANEAADIDASDEINERIAYSPTQAELDAADDPDVHADHVEVNIPLGDAHAVVRDRVEQLVEAAEDNGVLQEVIVDPGDGEYHSVEVGIRPLENWNEAGQSGFENFHVVLGVRGGLSIASVDSLMAGSRSLEDWDRLLRYVRSAN